MPRVLPAARRLEMIASPSVDDGDFVIRLSIHDAETGEKVPFQGPMFDGPIRVAKIANGLGWKSGRPYFVLECGGVPEDRHG